MPLGSKVLGSVIADGSYRLELPTLVENQSIETISVSANGTVTITLPTLQQQRNINAITVTDTVNLSALNQSENIDVSNFNIVDTFSLPTFTQTETIDTTGLNISDYIILPQLLRHGSINVPTIIDTVNIPTFTQSESIDVSEFTIYDSRVQFEMESGGPGLKVGDIVEASEKDHDLLGNMFVRYKIVGKVTDIMELPGEWGGDRYKIDFDTSSNSIYEIYQILNQYGEELEFAVWGNTTDTTRQDSILISSDLEGSPFIDVIDGVDNVDDIVGYNYINPAKIKTRIGLLDELDNYGNTAFSGISGYGLWSDNVYLEGEFSIVNPGDIDQTSLANNADANATVGANWGTNLDSIPDRFKFDGVPASTGIYMTSNFIGFYENGGIGSWPIKIKNETGTGKLYIGNSGGTDYISFDTSTGNIVSTMSINIQNPGDLDQTDLSNSADAGATIGADYDVDLTNIPEKLLDLPTKTGVHITDTYIGFYDYSTVSWPVIIWNDSGIGKCRFQRLGDGYNAFDWDGANLTMGNTDFYFKFVDTTTTADAGIFIMNDNPASGNYPFNILTTSNSGVRYFNWPEAAGSMFTMSYVDAGTEIGQVTIWRDVTGSDPTEYQINNFDNILLDHNTGGHVDTGTIRVDEVKWKSATQTGKSGLDEYLKVKDANDNVKYIKLYS